MVIPPFSFDITDYLVEGENVLVVSAVDHERARVCSEYGGIKWNTAEVGNAWSYGKTVTTEQEFIERYKGLTDALLDNENIMGFCYTKLYDVEQECNGMMTYDRQFKFDPEIFRTINTRKAKIED